ncbi:hypothetical protein HispidOSU_011128 [Sigmodon hispidus]
MEDPAGVSELERGAEELERLKEERSEEGSQDQEQRACGGGSLCPPPPSLEESCLSSSEDEKSGSASEVEEKGRHTQRFRRERYKSRAKEPPSREVVPSAPPAPLPYVQPSYGPCAPDYSEL